MVPGSSFPASPQGSQQFVPRALRCHGHTLPPTITGLTLLQDPAGFGLPIEIFHDLIVNAAPPFEADIEKLWMTGHEGFQPAFALGKGVEEASEGTDPVLAPQHQSFSALPQTVSVVRPAEKILRKGRGGFDVAGGSDAHQFLQEKRRVFSMFKNMGGNHINESLVAEGQSVGVPHHERPGFPDQRPQSLRVIIEKPVAEHIGAWVRGVAAPQVQYQPFGRDLQMS